MKKLFCLLTALAASLMLCVSAFAADNGALVVLGDSIATGYGLPGYKPGDNTSAKDSFGNRLGAQSKDYANFAVDGRTSAELLAAMDNADITEKIKTADNVVISIGGNDFLVPLSLALMEAVTKDEELMGLFMGDNANPSEADVKLLQEKLEPVMRDALNSVDVNKTFDNLDGIFRKIKTLNPDCTIVTFTVYNPFEGNKDMAFFDENAKTLLDKLNAKIYAAAGLNGVKVVDIFTAFKGNAAKYTNISSMDVHPSKDGHALYYEKLLPELSAGGQTSKPADEKPVIAPNAPNPGTGDLGMTSAVCAAALCSAIAIGTRKKR